MVRTFKLGGRRVAVDWERDLNDEQRAAVMAPGGPMLIIAGAGSGKTRVLTYRLAWLLAQGVRPDRVLLMTFTNRAAREMLQRVEQLVPHESGAIWGGTFHHIANRVLRTHGTHVGLSSEFTILDREDAGDLLGVCVSELKVPIERRRFPRPRVLGAIASFRVNTAQTLERVLEERYPMFAALREPIDAVLTLYHQRKRRQQLVDYDDLLVEWLRLLDEHPAVRAQLAERFEHVLVDEYQDTNTLQRRIVDRLATRHRNLSVVGDDAQAIYSFRGADVRGMIEFRSRYPDTREARLEVNYRSTPEILEVANTSIAHNRTRLPKQLRPSRTGGLRPAFVPCADHFEQSRFIAEYILHLLDQGRDLFDIAVLYRSHWHAMEIQLELTARDIPFTVRGGLRFFEQMHIKDVLAMLRIGHNGHDELAWQRVLRLLPRIGGRLAQRVWDAIAGQPDPVTAASAPTLAAILPPAARPSLRRLARLLAGMVERADPAEQLTFVLEEYYGDHLDARYPNAAQRRQDIEAVRDFAAQYKTPEAFLSDVAITGDFTGETCEDGPDEQHFVTLTTVHQAKGLEWPVVLIPWMADGRFPTDLAMGTTAELEEERRVFHVAVTRAKDELYLLVPQVWSNYRRQRILMKPSRFLTELTPPNGGTPLLETMLIESGLPAVTSG
ncbi:MAG: ATP-dependent helicase [Phycisphaerales bacterium]|nr:ATP-dependent helicase [Phycisphaerales bacterium]